MQTNKYQNGISNIKQQRAKGRIGWSILCRTLRLGMEAGGAIHYKPRGKNVPGSHCTAASSTDSFACLRT